MANDEKTNTKPLETGKTEPAKAESAAKSLQTTKEKSKSATRKYRGKEVEWDEQIGGPVVHIDPTPAQAPAQAKVAKK